MVEFMPGIGGLGIDGEVAKSMERIMKKQGMKFKLSTKVRARDLCCCVVLTTCRGR